MKEVECRRGTPISLGIEEPLQEKILGGITFEA